MRTAAIAAIAVAAAGAIPVAFAAGLGVAPARLTTWSAAKAVPVSTCTLAATADAYAGIQSPGASYGSAPELLVENGTRRKRTFVRFDLASCVPAGARILRARLSLFLNDAPTVNRTWELHRVLGPWSEGGLTWDTQPVVAASATTSIGTGTSGRIWTNWDVAPDLQAFADGATHQGWRVWDQNESQNPGRGGGFAAREAGPSGPALSIEFYP